MQYRMQVSPARTMKVWYEPNIGWRPLDSDVDLSYEFPFFLSSSSRHVGAKKEKAGGLCEVGRGYVLYSVVGTL